jgi:GTPase SAR1 family protein
MQEPLREMTVEPLREMTVVLLGDSCIGKSAFFDRVVHETDTHQSTDAYSPGAYGLPHMCNNLGSTVVDHDGHRVKLNLVDIGAAIKTRHINVPAAMHMAQMNWLGTPSSAGPVIFIAGFDSTGKDTFARLEKDWLCHIPATAGSAVHTVLVAYKSDSPTRRVELAEMWSLADSHPLLEDKSVFEVDSFTGRGVDELCIHIASMWDNCRLERATRFDSAGRELMQAASRARDKLRQIADANGWSSVDASNSAEGADVATNSLGHLSLGPIAAAGLKTTCQAAATVVGAVALPAVAGGVMLAGVVRGVGASLADKDVDEYEFGDASRRALGALAGKPADEYQFGDASRRALGALAGKPADEYQFGDVSRRMFAAFTGTRPSRPPPSPPPPPVLSPLNSTPPRGAPRPPPPPTTTTTTTTSPPPTPTPAFVPVD